MKDSLLKTKLPFGLLELNAEGDVIRYGLGLTFGRRQADHFWVTPVTEVVGWTALGGELKGWALGRAAWRPLGSERPFLPTRVPRLPHGLIHLYRRH